MSMSPLLVRDVSCIISEAIALLVDMIEESDNIEHMERAEAVALKANALSTTLLAELQDG